MCVNTPNSIINWKKPWNTQSFSFFIYLCLPPPPSSWRQIYLPFEQFYNELKICVFEPLYDTQIIPLISLFWVFMMRDIGERTKTWVIFRVIVFPDWYKFYLQNSPRDQVLTLKLLSIRISASLYGMLEARTR